MRLGSIDGKMGLSCRLSVSEGEVFNVATERYRLKGDRVEQKGGETMKEWKKTFFFNKKEFHYNKIKFNNPTERSVKIPIVFHFLAALNKPASLLEVGNVLSHYENHYE